MHTCEIRYLNAKKNFAEDVKAFQGKDAFEVLEKAKAWGRKNLENFHIDMIKWI